MSCGGTIVVGMSCGGTIVVGMSGEIVIRTISGQTIAIFMSCSAFFWY